MAVQSEVKESINIEDPDRVYKLSLQNFVSIFDPKSVAKKEA